MQGQEFTLMCLQHIKFSLFSKLGLNTVQQDTFVIKRKSKLNTNSQRNFCAFPLTVEVCFYKAYSVTSYIPFLFSGVWRPRRLPGGSVWGLTSCFVQEVGQKAAHDRLVTDDQHVLLPLQFHDHRLQPLHQVLIGLSQKTHTQKRESGRVNKTLGLRNNDRKRAKRTARTLTLLFTHPADYATGLTLTRFP